MKYACLIFLTCLFFYGCKKNVEIPDNEPTAKVQFQGLRITNTITNAGVDDGWTYSHSFNINVDYGEPIIHAGNGYFSFKMFIADNSITGTPFYLAPFQQGLTLDSLTIYTTKAVDVGDYEYDYTSLLPKQTAGYIPVGFNKVYSGQSNGDYTKIKITKTYSLRLKNQFTGIIETRIFSDGTFEARMTDDKFGDDPYKFVNGSFTAAEIIQ